MIVFLGFSRYHSVNSHQQHFHLQLSRTFAPAYQAGKPLKEKERLKKNENQVH
jgi:hypothetical protein